MSNIINDELLERAHEYSEEFTSTTLGNAIDKAIDENDLDTLYYLVGQADIRYQAIVHAEEFAL